MKSDDYEDMIGLDHHVSLNRRQMSMHDRAAQFSPFASLRGYDDEIEETARITEERIRPKEGIEERFQNLLKIVGNHPVVKVVYFVEDRKKTGGKYELFVGEIKRIDEAERKIVFKTGKEINLSDLFDIDICEEKDK